MNTSPASRLSALFLSLAINGLMMGLVAYLFDGRLHQAVSLSASLAGAVLPRVLC